MSAMPIDWSPIEGISLPQFYEVRIRCGGYFDEAGSVEVARAVGLDPVAWGRAYPRWQAREAADMSDPALVQLHEEIVTRVHGPLGDIDVLAYADMNATLHRNGGDLQAACKKLGQDAILFSRTSFAMVERMAREPRLAAHYAVAYARSKKLGGEAVRKLRGDALRLPGASAQGFVPRRQRKEPRPGLGQLRARRCGHCGAYKVKPHDRCWLYCDRCGALFDYDARKMAPKELAQAEEAALTLRMCLENERWPKDPAARAQQRTEGERWLKRIVLELFPFDYPARVADPAYREALVTGWLAPASTCWAASSRCHATGEAVTRAQSELAGKKKPSADLINELYEVTLAHAEAQAAEADAAGIFSTHPDPLTPALWVHHNKSAFVQVFGEKLSAADREALIDRAGLREEFVSSTPAELHAVGCPCGAELEVPAGALRVLCEACGILHDCSQRRACVSCGATIVGDWAAVRAATGSVACPYCAVRWEEA